MAYLQARKNKEGEVVSYSIRVYKGRDPRTGKQLTPYTMTWRVPPGWSEKRARKEAEKQAALFEQQCREGYLSDGRQTFAQYAEYVLELKERTGLKHLTLIHYRQSLKRVLPFLGHMKLGDIRPQHLNYLYQQLALPQAREDNEKALARPALWQLLEARGLGNRVLDREGRHISVERLRKGEGVKPDTAQRLAEALGAPYSLLFSTRREERCLSQRTIVNCHLLVSVVLGQAEREMRIALNPARRASPPKGESGDPNYFQEEEVGQILRALESESLKWKTAIHLLLVSGCRRGELLGLKWDHVDWENGQIHIDCTLLYAGDRGVYEGSPKTRDSVRTIKLPQETMCLLEEYRQWQQARKEELGDKWEESPYVFPGERGGRMNPSQLGNWLVRFQKRHNLPHLNPHAFRHTMTSMLFFHGVDSVSISHRLGHSSVSTTTSIYSHVMKEAESRISDCMAHVLLSTRAPHAPDTEDEPQEEFSTNREESGENLNKS